MNERESDRSQDAEQRKEIVHALAESGLYRDYANDFGRATGLPVSLTAVESWQLAHRGLPRESPFCAMLAQHCPACAACLRTQHRLAQAAAQAAHTVECLHGLYETAVPVRAGKHLFGFVRTGQVFRRPPTPRAFERVLKRLARWGVMLDAARLRRAYFTTRVIEAAQYRSAVGLLGFLAQHLSVLSNQILLQPIQTELPMVSRAKKFIEANHGERLSLRQVAGAAGASPFYFCKQFKRATGINFSSYVARLRVEKAKNLLLNPNYHITEIAYAVGFGSLSHFNRTFLQLAGFSPTAYRAQLGAWQSGRERTGNNKRNRPGPPIGSKEDFLRNSRVGRSEEPNGCTREGMSGQSVSARAKARVLRVPLPEIEKAKPEAVEIKTPETARLNFGICRFCLTGGIEGKTPLKRLIRSAASPTAQGVIIETNKGPTWQRKSIPNPKRGTPGSRRSPLPHPRR